MASEWYYDQDYDDDEYDDEEDMDGWSGCFPDRCLMPSEHLRSECYDVEMAQAWADEQRRTA